MKKILSCLALFLCLALLLTACGGDRTPEETASAGQRRERSEAVSDPTPAPAETAAPAEASDPTASPAEAPAAAQAVRVGFERQDGLDNEQVSITGLTAEGDAVWQRQYSSAYRTELTLLEKIGLWQDRYYFNHQGTVVCLSLADGEELWTNDGFGGASISYLLGSDGNIYICGYYGPDFYAVNSRGQTLINYRSISDDYYWPSDLRWYSDWEIEGTFYGGADVPQEGVKFIIDLYKPSYRMAD